MSTNNKIVVFEGDIGNDYEDMLESLSDRFEIIVLNNLYKEPEKLKQLPVINPDYIFIGTTSSRMKEKQKVLSAFDALKYAPKAVIFPSNSTAEVLLGVAREYKALGTKFYITGYNGEIEELEWI